MTRLCPSCERQLLRAIGAVLVAAGAITALQAVV